MLGLSELKQTKVYQEAKQEGKQEGKHEGKQEAIPRMLQLGLSLEVIAQSLDLLLEVVKQAAQSFYEQNIIAFIQLLNYQRSLFSQQDLAELNQLVAPLPDDLEELSKAIATWCNQEEHSAHLNALRQVRQTLSNSALEQVSGTHSDTKTPDYPLNKQTLSHAIEQSSSAN